MMTQPHILVVDPTPNLADLLHDVLTDAGYAVSRRSQLTDPVREIALIDPDLLIIEFAWHDAHDDWHMLRRLRTEEATRHIPVILCTAAVRETAAVTRELEELDVPVLLKPFELDQLLGAVAAAGPESASRYRKSDAARTGETQT